MAQSKQEFESLAKKPISTGKVAKNEPVVTICRVDAG